LEQPFVLVFRERTERRQREWQREDRENGREKSERMRITQSALPEKLSEKLPDLSLTSL